MGTLTKFSGLFSNLLQLKLERVKRVKRVNDVKIDNFLLYDYITCK